MSSFSIFISHDTRDQTLAELLKSLLEQIFLNAEVFVSGRDLLGGDVWIQEIRSRLEKSSSIVALVTPVSLGNPWVLFESGAGFVEGKTIPLAAGGLSFVDLPRPFQLLQARIYDSEGLQKLLADVAHLGQVRIPSKCPGLEETIAAADEFVQLRDRELSQERQPPARTTPTRVATADDSDSHDPILVRRYEELALRTRVALIRSIKRAEATTTIPTDEELQEMSIGDLTEVASYANVPYPRLEVVGVKLYRISIPSLSDPQWKKINAERKLSGLEAEISQFERSLDAKVA